MSNRRFSRFVFSFIAAGALLTGAAACSSEGGEADPGEGIVDDASGRGAPDDVGTDGAGNDDPGTDGAGTGDENSDDTGGSGDGNVTATYQPARGTASIDDIDDACAWIPADEIEGFTSSSGLSADGFGIPGVDVQCEYEDDAGAVWVQVAYREVEPGLDLTEELNADVPTIEWVESLDGVGEQAVVLEGPMGSAQVDIVDGDLWVMANVIISGDADGAQQAAVDIALRGIGAD